MGGEILVEPAQADVLDAGHVLADAGDTEASFGTRYGVAVEYFDFRIDERKLAASAFGERFGDGIGVDDNEAYVLAYLGGSKAYALGFVHSLEHQRHKVFEPFGAFAYGLGYFAEHRVSVQVNR